MMDTGQMRMPALKIQSSGM